MKQIVGIAVVLALCGCSGKTRSPVDESWVGYHSNGLPKWTITSAIPTELRPEPRPKTGDAAKESARRGEHDGKPLCYVRLAALEIPPDCFEAARGDAEFFVERLRAENEVSKPRYFRTLEVDGRQVAVRGNIVMRSFANGGGTCSAEQIDEVQRGKGYVLAIKPLQIDDSGCTILFAMQGVDVWTAADQAAATWHMGTKVRLALGESYTEWATVRKGENHVLAIAQLEKLTKGENWHHSPPTLTTAN